LQIFNLHFAILNLQSFEQATRNAALLARQGKRPYNRHSLPSLPPVDANLCANASACPSRILSQNRTLSLRDVFYLVAATMSYLVIAAKVGAEARVIPATLAFAASPNRASFGECRA
jgi:hypothetical protein